MQDDKYNQCKIIILNKKDNTEVTTIKLLSVKKAEAMKLNIEYDNNFIVKIYRMRINEIDKECFNEFFNRIRNGYTI